MTRFLETSYDWPYKEYITVPKYFRDVIKCAKIGPITKNENLLKINSGRSVL